MNTTISKIHYSVSARNIAALALDEQDFVGMDSSDDLLRQLARIGIIVGEDELDSMISHAQKVIGSGGGAAYGMDSIQQNLTSPTVVAPVQFLQTFLPGIVQYLTGARQIDDLIGKATVGSWEEEQIVQRAVETTGAAVPYGDQTNVPLMNWNPQFVVRTIVRYEAGFRIGRNEEMRSARAGFNSPDEKRRAASQALDIARNDVGFYGYNAGANATYGYLNDPNLPAYVEVAATGTGSTTTWSTKTTLEIISDILTALQSLRTQSKNVIDVKKTPITMGVAMSAVDYLSTPTDLGYSVQQWMTENYPNIRVQSAPQLDSAHSSLNVFYVSADNVTDGSTDGGAVWLQAIQTQFMVLGVAQHAKGYEEDYTNATAGAMCKRPFAVVRRFGI